MDMTRISSGDAILALVRASTVSTQRQKWLWEGRIPMDTPSIFAGHGGEGKTTYGLYLAAKLTRGTLEGEHHGKASHVLIWSGEDRAETVLVPRLQAADAVLDRVHIVQGVHNEARDVQSNPPSWDEVGEPREEKWSAPIFPDDLPLIEEAIRQTGAVLVIFDPLTSITSGDLNKTADVRRTLDGIAEVTRRTGAVALGIMHTNKGSGAISNTLSGNHAFRDTVRSLFFFASDEETGQKIVTQDKNNYAANMSASLAFDLRDTTIETHDGEVIHVAQVVDLGESPISVQDIVNREGQSAAGHNDTTPAERWLVEYLHDPARGGSAPATQIVEAGDRKGFPERTVQRAGQKTCKKIRAGFQGASTWVLDTTTPATQAAIDAIDATPASAQKSRGDSGESGSPATPATPSLSTGESGINGKSGKSRGRSALAPVTPITPPAGQDLSLDLEGI